MKDAQPVGTSLEVLAPYLPYGIEVVNVNVTMNEVHPRGIVRSVRLFTNGGAILTFAGGDAHSNNCRPVLKPFSQLCEPLEDGTVPACLLANLIYAGSEEPITDAEFKEVSAGFGHFNELVVTVEGAGIMCIYEDWLIDTYGNCMVPPAAYDYLRSLHFAVGLQPSQFIAKA